MKTDFLKYILIAPVLLLVTWTISCSGRPGKKGAETGAGGISNSALPAAVRLIRMDLPAENAEFRLKDEVKVVLTPDGDNKTADSVKIYFDGKDVVTLKNGQLECIVPGSSLTTTGRKAIKAVAYGNKNIQAITRFIIIYSDTKPGKKGFNVVHTFPHDNGAFTQGLFYEGGVMYEGTGQEAGSSLREVEIETGKIRRQLNLDPSLFGEGITLYNGRIFQVTWQNKVGFIYDKSDFSLVNKIFYQTEGWGLTTIDKRIVMSDGSNVLYFYEPEMFNVVSRIEVYDNEKKVDQLNELEYINGEIWANIWQTDLIARIDPLTGKVNSYVDLGTLFPASERINTGSDVLNGIAYDPAGKRIFVTGKRWPKLYEITVTE